MSLLAIALYDVVEQRSVELHYIAFYSYNSDSGREERL